MQKCRNNQHYPCQKKERESRTLNFLDRRKMQTSNKPINHHTPFPSLAEGSFCRNRFAKLAHQAPWILSQVPASWTPTRNGAFDFHQ